MAILSKIQAKQVINKWKYENKKIVFTNGCFDIIHRGHIEYLKQAKELGDYLIVGLNSDKSVERLKGETRPYQTESDRAEILNSFRFIDVVIIFEEDTPLKLICELKPNILVKGGDYNLNAIVGAKEMQDWRGEVKILPFLKGYGTSKLIDKIVNN